MIRITILGNNSALPAFGRHPSSQVVALEEQLFLVDCGEATQIQMQRFNIRRRRINYIFISHLHGDHYFGLMGLITSMGLMGRTAPLHIFGPAALKLIIDLQLEAAATVLPYPLLFTALEPDQSQSLIHEPHYTVLSFPVEHRIPCHGFSFTLKHPERKILPDKCRAYEIPTAFFNRLKKGEDYTRKDGELVKNEWVTQAGPPDKKYVYCADTRTTARILPYIADADGIYHESTYLDDNREKAYQRFHSTALQAATTAAAAGVKRLFLGHFSSKYQDLRVFYEEASSVFPDVEVTVEGTTYEL